MGKRLIHSNEVHLISEAELKAAARKMVENLYLAAGSMEGFDFYKVVNAYFTDLEKRHQINKLLKIVDDPECCEAAAEEAVAEEATIE